MINILMKSERDEAGLKEQMKVMQGHYFLKAEELLLEILSQEKAQEEKKSEETNDSLTVYDNRTNKTYELPVTDGSINATQLS